MGLASNLFAHFIFCLLVQSVFAAGAIKMATTTSTENSGLLNYIIPDFEKTYGIDVHVIAVGTGRAIKLGENGDVDLILVHDRAAEERFVRDGVGINRKEVMYNDFVIAGPPEDPARIGNSEDAVSAFKKIYSYFTLHYRSAGFISRGDGSGTHKKEMSLWSEAGLKPHGRWYLETGQGMDASLTIAHEKNGYLLSDRATYLSYRDKIDLAILFEGDKRLYNPYAIIAINPRKHPRVNYKEAILFIEWITSGNVQGKIGDYKKYGKVLFYPILNSFPYRREE